MDDGKIVSGVAPIALFVYRRAKHLETTLRALSANTCAAESDLFVFSDGWISHDDRSDVQSVRDIASKITGFRTVTVVKRPVNLGLSRSIILGVTEILERYGRVIVLEDDIVTSPYFLRYMNDALSLYQADEMIASIHGYTYPVHGTLPETFFLRGTDCWGWATWSRAWDLFDADGAFLLKTLEKRRLVHAFNLGGAYPYSRMLRDQVRQRNDSWAIRWHASAFLGGKLTLFPGQSLVRNIGTDGTGRHCTETALMDVPLAERPVRVGGVPVEENVAARKLIANFWRRVRLKQLLAKLHLYRPSSSGASVV